jgi:hypothetical protein
MTNKTRNIRLLLVGFALTFFVSGAAVLYLTEIAKGKDLSPEGWLKILFSYHMACWMFLGMFANYYWDLIRAGKSLGNAETSQIFLPVCVAPIVFYGIWSQWDQQKIAFSLNLLAFQSGFFWQVIFSKANTTVASTGSLPDLPTSTRESTTQPQQSV